MINKKTLQSLNESGCYKNFHETHQECKDFSILKSSQFTRRYPQAGTPQADTRAQRWGGPYAARVTPNAVRTAQRFAELAHTHGCEPAALAVRWLCGQPAVTAPIIGPRNIAQLDAYLNALALDLTPELRSAIDALVPPGSAVTDFHNNSGWMRMHVGISD